MAHIRNIALLLTALAAAPVLAADRNVPAEYPSIQAALDAAVDGDRVVVAPGRYYEALRFPPRNIHLFASAGPRQTTIDAQELGTVVTFDGAPGRGAIVEGFTLTNGLDAQRRNAGGVHIGEGASPIVRGNVIRQNRGYGDGHGVSLYRPASPLIEANEIRHNRGGPGFFGSGGGGGIGIYGSSCFGVPNCGAEIRNNYIGNNYAMSYSNGGGIALNGARVAVTGNVIEYNTANNGGGGLSSVNGSPALVENNLFHANLAGQVGGGIESVVSQGDVGPRILNNTFVANEATFGSAIYTTGFDSQSRIANNLISALGTGAALDCAVFGNDPPPVTGHNVVHAPQGVAYGGQCAGMAGANGNQSTQPVFVGEFDFRLQSGSPGVDDGDNSASTQTTDLAGRTRLLDGDGDDVAVIDVGAYELPPPTLFADSFEPQP